MTSIESHYLPLIQSGEVLDSFVLHAWADSVGLPEWPALECWRNYIGRAVLHFEAAARNSDDYVDARDLIGQIVQGQISGYQPQFPSLMPPAAREIIECWLAGHEYS